MENRHGLAVDGSITQATGTAERKAALTMMDRIRHALTILGWTGVTTKPA